MSRKAIYRDGYFKVSRRLLDSSLWCEDSDVLRVFLALVALSQDPGSPRNGTVFIARRQLAARCFMTEERLDECIAVLSRSDAQSRTSANDGRRVEVLPNGFRVLNYSLYHDRDKDEKLSEERSRAGRVGGRHSGKARKAQQDNSKQNASKPEANPKQNEATETETERETETESEKETETVQLTTFAVAKPASHEVAAKFVQIYNAALERRVGLTAGIAKGVHARLKAGYRPWQVLSLPILVASRPMTPEMDRAMRPEILLRDGSRPRMTKAGYTAGGTDWLERELQQLDRAVLDPRLTWIAKESGLLETLQAAGVGVRQESGL